MRTQGRQIKPRDAIRPGRHFCVAAGFGVLVHVWFSVHRMAMCSLRARKVACAFACLLAACSRDGTGAFDDALQGRQPPRRAPSVPLGATSAPPADSFSSRLLEANKGTRSKTPGASRRSGPEGAVRQADDLAPLYVADQVAIEFPDWLVRALDALDQRVDPSFPAPCDKPSVVDGVRALAAPDRVIVHCCDVRAMGDWPNCEDCRERRPCSYLIASARGWTRVQTDEDLARALGPVRSPIEALGRVAIKEHLLLLQPGPYPMFYEVDRQPNVVKVVAPEVNRVGDGFDVTALQTSTYGCWPVLFQLEVHVGTDGSTWDLERKKLIDTTGSLCVHE